MFLEGHDTYRLTLKKSANGLADGIHCRHGREIRYLLFECFLANQC